jgi:hypothetical protein
MNEATTRKLEELLSINQYGSLLVKSIQQRAELIDVLRNENSTLLNYAESIQLQELDCLRSAMNHPTTWSIKSPKKKSADKIRLNGKDIPVNVVQTWAAVDDTLCYVQPHKHFAIRIGPTLIHGNIGKMVDTHQPDKIKCCRIKNCKKANCSFYHDPIEHGGTECRNFIRDHMPPAMTSEQIAKFSDKIMHDLLTLLTLS